MPSGARSGAVEIRVPVPETDASNFGMMLAPFRTMGAPLEISSPRLLAVLSAAIVFSTVKRPESLRTPPPPDLEVFPAMVQWKRVSAASVL